MCFCALWLAGCATPGANAPAEDRGADKPSTPVVATAPTPATAATSPSPSPETPAIAKPSLGLENAGKPGYYAIKPGDTLVRIGLDTGQNWRDLQRWNGLDNPNVIEAGQILRVVPPASEANVASSKPLAPVSKTESKALDAKGNPATGVAVAVSAAGAGAGATPPSATNNGLPTASTARDTEEGLNWNWPATGPVATAFDETKNKGMDIVGKAGDPVFAAADGKVIYAGAGLPGFGNLVMVQHNNEYLTAYAHNQALLVKEEQSVKRGQKIAEMGSSDADRVQLHFELRRRGKPLDPAKLLPPR